MVVVMINKHIMLVLYMVHLMVNVNCGLPDTVLNTNQSLWKQLEALEHVHSFLKEVQKEIKESRDLLKSIPYDGLFNSSTERPMRTASISQLPDRKWTIQKDLFRYLSPTVSEGILRTDATNAVADGSTPPTGTTSFIRPSPPGVRDKFLEARDYVLPDIGPEYKDIFLPDMKRVGDTDKEAMASVTMGLNVLFVTVPSPGEVLQGEVAFHTTTVDPHPTLHSLLVRDSSGYISIGFEMFCMLVAEKDPGTVKAVLEKSERVIVRMEHERHDRFEWMNEPLRTVLNTMATWLSPEILQVDEVQYKARLMRETMKNRREALSDYVNRILDFADGLVKEEDGEEIFDVLDAFRDFPQKDKKGHKRTADKMCEDLIYAFSHPFYFETLDRRRLIGAANRAIRERFAHLNIFRRQAGRGKKKDDHHRVSINSRYELKQAWNTQRNSRVPTYGYKFSISHRNSATYNRNLRRNLYNTKNANDYNRSHKQSDRNNNMKYVNAYKQKNKERTSTRKIHDNIEPITNENVIMITKKTLDRDTMNNGKVTEVLGAQKITRAHKRLVDTKQRKKDLIYTRPNIDTKGIIGYKDNTKHEPIDFRSYTKQNKISTRSKYNRRYSKNQNNSDTKIIKQIQNTTKSVPKDVKINRNYDLSMNLNHSDEKLVLDVKLLNRVLNVTSEESLTNESLIDESVVTDEDEDMLKNLYDAFYN